MLEVDKAAAFMSPYGFTYVNRPLLTSSKEVCSLFNHCAAPRRMEKLWRAFILHKGWVGAADMQTHKNTHAWNAWSREVTRRVTMAS